MHNLLLDFISSYISLDEEEKEAITSLSLFRNVEKGTILLKTGEVSKVGYFILKGCLRKYYMVEGEEKTTAFYTEMEGLTPQSLIDHKPSEYYISCVEDSVITVSTMELETEMLEKFPKFEKLCRLVSEDLLAKKQIEFDHFKTSSPEERYLCLLRDRPDLIQRVPLNYLASYIGITPPSLSRLRARIQKNGKNPAPGLSA